MRPWSIHSLVPAGRVCKPPLCCCAPALQCRAPPRPGAASLAVHRHLHAVGLPAKGEADVGAARGRGVRWWGGCRLGNAPSPPPVVLSGHVGSPLLRPPGPPPHRLSPITIWLMPDSSSFWCCAGTPVAASSAALISAGRASGRSSTVTSCPHARWLVRILTCGAQGGAAPGSTHAWSGGRRRGSGRAGACAASSSPGAP